MKLSDGHLDAVESGLENASDAANLIADDMGRRIATAVLSMPAVCLFVDRRLPNRRGAFAAAHAELQERCAALGLPQRSVDDAHSFLTISLEQAISVLFGRLQRSWS